MTGEIKKTVVNMSGSFVKIMEKENVPVVEALLTDAADFADLILLSSPSLFPVIYGDRVKKTVGNLYRSPRNLFSYEHTFFAELGGKKVSVLLGYDWQTKRKEKLRTGLLMIREMKLDFLRKLPAMLKAMNVIGTVNHGEYYISNLATYPDYRNTGIGTILIREAEERAKMKGADKLALDVETENSRAVELYSRLGFSTVAKSFLQLGRGRSFEFYRMCKELK